MIRRGGAKIFFTKGGHGIFLGGHTKKKNTLDLKTEDGPNDFNSAVELKFCVAIAKIDQKNISGKVANNNLYIIINANQKIKTTTTANFKFSHFRTY